MGQILYLLSSEDKEETNIGLMEDSRKAKERLEKILRSYFDDEGIKVLSLEPKGKPYLGNFEAKCKDGDSEEFAVQLEKTEVWDI